MKKTDVKLSDVTKIKLKNNDSVKRIMTFLYGYKNIMNF